MLNFLALGEVAPSTTLGDILTVTLSFVILMLLLKKFAWGQVTDMLKKREDQIANDLDSAEQARISAAELEEKRQKQLLSSKTEAATIIKSAKESGEQSRQNILNETKEDAARIKAKAQQDIEQQREEALSSVKDDVTELSLQIASKLLSKELNADTHAALIDSYIEKLGASDEA